MDLPRTGREYAHDTITGLPDDVQLEVSTDQQTWTPMQRDGDTVRVLLAGPDATDDDPADTLRLTTGSHQLTVRAVDHPEIVERFWGWVHVH